MPYGLSVGRAVGRRAAKARPKPKPKPPAPRPAPRAAPVPAQRTGPARPAPRRPEGTSLSERRQARVDARVGRRLSRVHAMLQPDPMHAGRKAQRDKVRRVKTAAVRKGKIQPEAQAPIRPSIKNPTKKQRRASLRSLERSVARSRRRFQREYGAEELNKYDEQGGARKLADAPTRHLYNQTAAARERRDRVTRIVNPGPRAEWKPSPKGEKSAASFVPIVAAIEGAADLAAKELPPGAARSASSGLRLLRAPDLAIQETLKDPIGMTKANLKFVRDVAHGAGSAAVGAAVHPRSIPGKVKDLPGDMWEDLSEFYGPVTRGQYGSFRHKVRDQGSLRVGVDFFPAGMGVSRALGGVARAGKLRPEDRSLMKGERPALRTTGVPRPQRTSKYYFKARRQRKWDQRRARHQEGKGKILGSRARWRIENKRERLNESQARMANREAGKVVEVAPIYTHLANAGERGRVAGMRARHHARKLYDLKRDVHRVNREIDKLTPEEQRAFWYVAGPTPMRASTHAAEIDATLARMEENIAAARVSTKDKGGVFDNLDEIRQLREDIPNSFTDRLADFVDSLGPDDFRIAHEDPRLRPMQAAMRRAAGSAPYIGGGIRQGEFGDGPDPEPDPDPDFADRAEERAEWAAEYRYGKNPGESLDEYIARQEREIEQDDVEFKIDEEILASLSPEERAQLESLDADARARFKEMNAPIALTPDNISEELSKVFKPKDEAPEPEPEPQPQYRNLPEGHTVLKASVSGRYQLRQTDKGRFYVWDAKDKERLAAADSTGAAGGLMRSQVRAEERFHAWAYMDPEPKDKYVLSPAASAAKRGVTYKDMHFTSEKQILEAFKGKAITAGEMKELRAQIRHGGRSDTPAPPPAAATPEPPDPEPVAPLEPPKLTTAQTAALAQLLKTGSASPRNVLTIRMYDRLEEMGLVERSSPDDPRLRTLTEYGRQVAAGPDAPAALKDGATVPPLRYTGDETDLDFLRRVRREGAARGHGRPLYFPGERFDADALPEPAMTGSPRMAVPRQYHGKLARVGREDRRPKGYTRGRQRSIHAKHTSAMLQEFLSTNALRQIRYLNDNDEVITVPAFGGNRLGMQDAAARAGLNPNDYVFYNPGITETRLQDIRADRDRSGGDDPSNPDIDERTSMELDQSDLHDAIQHGTVPNDEAFPNGWFIIPKAPQSELLKSMEPPSTLEKIARVGYDRPKNVASRVVLGTNPSWLAFQIMSNAGMAGAAMRGNYLNVPQSQQFKKRLSREELQNFEEMANSGVARGWGDTDHYFTGDGHPNWVTQGFRNFSETKAGRYVHHGNPINMILAGDYHQNRLFREAVLFDSLKRQAYKDMREAGEDVLGLQDKMKGIFSLGPVDSMRAALRSRKDFEMHAQRVTDFLGDYVTYTAAERAAFKRFPMFYGFLRFSLRLLFYTMPFKHPVTTAVLANLGRMQTDEVRDLLGGDEMPWAMGRLYWTEDGQLKHIDAQRANPALNAILDMQHPGQALAMLSPLHVHLLEQAATHGSLFKDKQWRINGKSAEFGAQHQDYGNFWDVFNPGSPRNRIALSTGLNLVAPYRAYEQATNLRPHGDDSLAWDKRPIKYSNDDARGQEVNRNIAAAERQAREEGGTAELWAKELLGVIPRDSMDPELAERIRINKARREGRGKKPPPKKNPFLSGARGSVGGLGGGGGDIGGLGSGGGGIGGLP